MPYDPNLPQENTEIDAAQMRAQFHGVVDLIQAIPAGPPGPQGTQGPPGGEGAPGMPGLPGTPGVAVTGAIVDFTNTADPGSPASASASFDGANVRFIFTIPRGADGTQGPPGLGVVGAMVDSVTTVSPGVPATASASFDGATVHFTFSIPQGEQGIQGPQGLTGPPGEVTSAALATAIAGTSANTNAVTTLDTPFVNDPPTLADMEIMRAKVNEMILAARR